MTYLHLLVRRKAQAHRPGLVGLAMLPLLAGCMDQVGPVSDPGTSTPSATVVQLSPRAATLQPGVSVQFLADNNAKVLWTSNGGRLDDHGAFQSDSAGTFMVVARAPNGSSDTAAVTVMTAAATVPELQVSPMAAAIRPGQSMKFTALGRNGPVTVRWQAAGGTIDSDGTFHAGRENGIFRIWARSQANNLADSARVGVGSVYAPPVDSMPSGTPPDTVPSVTPPTTPPVTPPPATPPPATPPPVTPPPPSDPVINPPPINPSAPIDWTHPLSASLPTDAAQLVALGIIGPTITAAQSSALGGSFATYESQWLSYAQQHWQADGADWANANYYDRALQFYALWIRTGDAKWRARADSIEVNYRANYLEPNDYHASPHWAQPEGVFLHWWLTGDAASRKATLGLATMVSPQLYGLHTHPEYFEGRIQARMLLSNLLACRTGDASQNWCLIADQVAQDQVTAQLPNGCYQYRVNTVDMTQAALIGQSNFMEGLRGDALVKYYMWRKQDPAVASAVVKLADCLMGQWSESTQTFKYWSTDASASTDLADLNGLFLTTYGFAYYVTHDAKYKTFGDKVFASGVKGAWLQGTKQYNETYYDSYLYLWFRQQ